MYFPFCCYLAVPFLCFSSLTKWVWVCNFHSISQPALMSGEGLDVLEKKGKRTCWQGACRQNWCCDVLLIGSYHSQLWWAGPCYGQLVFTLWDRTYLLYICECDNSNFSWIFRELNGILFILSADEQACGFAGEKSSRRAIPWTPFYVVCRQVK